MIVFDYMDKSIKEITAETYKPGRYLTTSMMTKSQRMLVIAHYIKCSKELVVYIQNSESELVKALRQAQQGMISGKLPFNIVVLLVLMQKVEEEMNNTNAAPQQEREV